MTLLVWDMPEPPEGEKFCSACVMYLLGELHATYKAELEAAAMDGSTDTKVFRPKIPRLPQLAKVRTLMGEAPNLGALDLCWSHAGGLQARPVSKLAIPDGIPPGLTKGRG